MRVFPYEFTHKAKEMPRKEKRKEERLDTFSKHLHMNDKIKRSLLLENNRIQLRHLQLSDVTEKYCEWMNDPEVNQYMDSRFYPPTFEHLRDYVARTLEDPNTVFVAIILKENNEHIGNIKLGPINHHHRFGDVGVVIGEKDCWGKGYAAEAISLLTSHAFKVLKLHKLTAGCLASNHGSFKAFQNAGFLVEGIRKSHEYCNGHYVDAVMLGIVNTEGE